jgi:sugar/nucleoside kinase (ribokinase family)
MRQPLPVLVAGHICLDLIPRLDGLPAGQFASLFQPGRLIEVGPIAFSTGGCVANTGLALNRLGVSTRLAGKLGDDFFGAAVQRVLRGEGAHLAEGMVVDPGASTSYTIIVSPPGVDRSFLHHPGANQTFCAADVSDGALSGAGLLHFGYPTIMERMYARDGAELAALFGRAKSQGLTTSLDMSFPDPNSSSGKADWQAIFRRTLPCVDIFMPSFEELLFMLRRAAYERLAQSAGGGGLLACATPELLADLAEEVVGMGVKIFGLKLGERGLYLRTAGQAAFSGFGRAAPDNLSTWADRELWAPCFQVQVAGTTGSGDATIAGFLSALLRSLTAEETVTAAVAVGACNVEAPDALSGIRPWEATLARIAAGWERLPLRIDHPGWRWNTGNQVWVGPGDGKR